MSFVSKCPKCRQPVTIPDGVDAAARVRCPLCAVIYPLGEALAQGPPALIPVDTDATGGLRPDSEALVKSDLVSEPYHVPDADDVAEPSEAETETPPGEGPQLDVWHKVGETPQIETGPADETSAATEGRRAPVDTEVFAFVGEEEPEGEPAAGTAGRPRRRKKEKSLAKEMLGVIVGGFFGLAAGYYALNWLGGPRFDFLKVYLPGVPHTAAYRPAVFQDDVPQERVDVDAKEPDGWPPERPVQREPQTPEARPEQSDSDLSDAQPWQPPIVDAEPAPLPAGYVGVREPPSFTSDELEAALKAAHDALRSEEASGEITADTYRLLCQLGYVLTFVEGSAADAQLARRKQAIRQVLQDLGNTPDKADQLEGLARSLLQSEDGYQGGILLAGTIGEVAERDGLYAATVQLAALPEPVIAVSRSRSLLTTGDRAVVLGTVVNNPAENVVGYGGSEERIVWTAMTVGVSQAPK